MKVTSETTYREFLTVMQVANTDLEPMFKEIEKLDLVSPLNVDFQNLTFGKLRRLQEEIKKPIEMFTKPFEILFDNEDYLNYKAFDCIRFILYVKSSLNKIVELFSKIQTKPTEDEIKAGIDKISGGFFYTADWYARRMGITDHDQVDNVKWGIIYLAKKKDFEEFQFQNNYRKVIEQKHQRNGKRQG